MLTKEQCSEALCDLYNRIYGETYSYEKEFDILSELIEEHFKDKKTLEERFKDYKGETIKDDPWE
ncbi:hypothetical protein ACTQX5_02640 [Faecalicoccus sp. LCP19S3_E3]|uniref:hypothetical protein n=1 Tax=unclassified Faecalicoccus TaxID=2643311 RepID=UPI003F907FF6